MGLQHQEGSIKARRRLKATKLAGGARLGMGWDLELGFPRASEEWDPRVYVCMCVRVPLHRGVSDPPAASPPGRADTAPLFCPDSLPLRPRSQIMPRFTSRARCTLTCVSSLEEPLRDLRAQALWTAGHLPPPPAPLQLG